MSRRNSLAELMGSAAAGKGNSMRLSNLGEILGEAMPELPRTAIGRHRLIRSLQQRFGANFRTLPGVSGLVKEFDDEIQLERRIAQLKQIKLKER